MPYSRDAKYYHIKEREAHLFEKGSFKTMLVQGIDYRLYKGDKYNKIKGAKAVIGRLKGCEKDCWRVQKFLVPKPESNGSPTLELQKYIDGERPIKITDINKIPPFGRIHKYWIRQSLSRKYRGFRQGPALPESYYYCDPYFLLDYWDLESWEFGNWVTQEDRMNYICSTGLALYDLRKVVKFKKEDMGFRDRLSIAIGARGQSAAIAHFEPKYFVINLTRYSRGLGKEYAFLNTGGVGALAHEWGHALDWYIGAFLERPFMGRGYASGGNTIRTKVDKSYSTRDTLRGHMERLMDKMIWKAPGEHTEYYKRLLQSIEDKKGDEYFIRRAEMFARGFEQYVQHQLEKDKTRNSFLTKTKYRTIWYMTPSELKPILPFYDKLLAATRKKMDKHK